MKTTIRSVRTPRQNLPPRVSAGAALCLLLAAGCINDYNPFTDPGNVGVYYHSRGIFDGDTVEAFAAETLRVSVLVKERVHRLRVTASANRSWSGIDTIIPPDYLSEDPFRFIVSFYDTGWQYVAFALEDGAQTLAGDSIAVYVSLPLAPDTVRGAFGDTLRLSTTAVRDPGVRYVWSFGAGSVVETPHSSASAVLITAADTAYGALYVTDGSYRSPSVPFSYLLVDSTGPRISCLNSEVRRGDTLFTGDSLLNFRVSITDRGVLPVDSASVNGAPFDFMFDTVHIKLLTGLAAHDSANPLLVEVFALDRFGIDNTTTATFFVVYLDTLQTPDQTMLLLTQPPDDSALATSADYLLSGSIYRGGADTSVVVLAVTINGGESGADTVELSEPVVSWSRAVTLSDSINTVLIHLLDSSRTDTLATLTRILLLDSLRTDVTPPAITLARIGNANAQNYYSTVPDVLLRVQVIDQGSGVDSVYYNGTPVAPWTSANWWADSLRLVHDKALSNYSVRVVDRAGNDTTYTYRIYYNRRPVFMLTPQSVTANIDTPYRDSVFAVDPDGDPLSYSLHTAPAGMSITAATGAIAWTPGAADTGLHTVIVRAYDGYQYTSHTYMIQVRDLGNYTPVRFLTTARAFPDYLQAGVDTMRVTLRVDSGSGAQPYRFSARVASSGQMLLNNAFEAEVVWAPDSTRLGQQQLVVFVRDNIGDADTLYATVRVVMPNRPCSLSIHFRSPALPDGTANLNALGRPDTMVFVIHDPDDPSIERHNVTLYQSRTGTRIAFDSTTTDTFRMVLDPMALDGYDTLTAIVRDIAGHGDTLVQRLYYGLPPSPPMLLSPAPGATGVAAPLELQWQCIDPDGDPLSYDVYLGTEPSSLAFLESTTATTYTLPVLAGATTYYWQIRARDWKRTVASATLSFTTQ